MQYYNRQKCVHEEEVCYGERYLRWLYGTGFLAPTLQTFLTSCRFPSYLYGLLQKSRFSRRKIRPFIEEFSVDTTEFLLPVEAFRSFNDFFCRRLKSESRPIDTSPHTLIAPADGRYLCYEKVAESHLLSIKGKQCDLLHFLGRQELEREFYGGTMVSVRLAPVDYHRCHFPIDSKIVEQYSLGNRLFSVNPLALSHVPQVYLENHRIISILENDLLGRYLFIEVGATFVGTIHELALPHIWYKKGAEKSFFSFGGSAVVLLFQRDRVKLAEDLLEQGRKEMATLVKMGESIGYIPT